MALRKPVRKKKKRYVPKKVCRFCVDKVEHIDYKDLRRIRNLMTERGKIISRRISGNCARHQRQLTTAIKRARNIALLPFAAHKGYGLGLLNEILGAMTGGSIPTMRGIPGKTPGEKYSCNFFFQVIHPEVFDAGSFAHGRSQAENLEAVIGDSLKEGNENCLLPGQPEARFAERSERNGGLLFSEKELDEFDLVAEECGIEKWDRSVFQVAE